MPADIQFNSSPDNDNVHSGESTLPRQIKRQKMSPICVRSVIRRSARLYKNVDSLQKPTPGGPKIAENPQHDVKTDISMSSPGKHNSHHHRIRMIGVFREIQVLWQSNEANCARNSRNYTGFRDSPAFFAAPSVVCQVNLPKRTTNDAGEIANDFPGSFVLLR